MPCMNGGTCIDSIATIQCNCPPGFDGNRCEKGTCFFLSKYYRVENEISVLFIIKLLYDNAF